MEGGDLQQKTATLIIKTPNQTQQDQTIEGVCLNWTVKELKSHLSSVYATKPAVSDQRLIHAGKLLSDNMPIKELFTQTAPVPMLHLVCPVRNPPKGLMGARPKLSSNTNSSPTSASAGSSTSSGAPELRQRRSTVPSPAAAPPHPQTPVSLPGASDTLVTATPGVPQVTQPVFPTYSLYSPQQLLWLQHIYARQYYMQYHAALVVAGTASTSPAGSIMPPHPVAGHQAPLAAPLANQNPLDNLPANQNPVQEGDFINHEAANQNMRMNAQGGPVMEDEDGMERDWLDWMYSAARLGIFLMILYFNSSPSRFLLVMFPLILMYLHTVGWIPFRGRVPVQEQNRVQPPEVQHNQQNENRNPDPVEEFADREEDEPAAPANVQEPLTAVLVPPHRVSAAWTAWIFFKTFFSSLIPEVPQGVAN
ncbi:homocysteine-responsive endoplasmic reticulum-resident ubiquitin-like domain member 1 protein [Thalassophryne amazonica]|uniref:homocysteine-responsive endoplasmic reticulum-resident ubiquitin-like domain member 1 protein n=1 Tax=Thalassophryne amazonica TaxID=390379 RepID=UPI00147234CE|nr:homocysteine-responsive endoplasmic reticulum-resident ubiquitin-like domain member 1 protein [Thalassophryne amazonica]